MNGCGENALRSKLAGQFGFAEASVGADDSVRPQNAVVFSETYGESAASSRADVGIGPYRVSANLHCPTNTHHKRKKEST